MANRVQELNFGKGWRTINWPFTLEGKALDYYDKNRRELGYVTTL